MAIVLMFFVLTIPQIGAVETQPSLENNKQMFGLCYLENIETGDFDPAARCPYLGGITILGGGEGTQTTIFDKKGGEELAHFEGPHIVIVLLMAGYHEYTENSRTYSAHSFGVFVLGS